MPVQEVSFFPLNGSSMHEITCSSHWRQKKIKIRSSLTWLHDGIWLALPPPSSLITPANLHATSALNLDDRPLLIKIRPCTSLYQRAWQLFQLPGPPSLTSIPPPTLHPPLSEIETRRGFQRMIRNAMNLRALHSIVPSEVIHLDDRSFTVYIPKNPRVRSLEVNVAALMNVELLLYITHNWLVSHRFLLSCLFLVCFVWDTSFSSAF